jgi:hypothetical protein
MREERVKQSARLRESLLGKALDPFSGEARKHVALVAFLAWVGLGADGLSSACYGPEEAFLALGAHTPLSLYLAAMTAVTVFVIAVVAMAPLLHEHIDVYCGSIVRNNAIHRQPPGTDHERHEPNHSMCPDARWYLTRTVLPAGMATQRRGGTRRGADRRHWRVRSAAA